MHIHAYAWLPCDLDSCEASECKVECREEHLRALSWAVGRLMTWDEQHETTGRKENQIKCSGLRVPRCNIKNNKLASEGQETLKGGDDTEEPHRRALSWAVGRLMTRDEQL